MTGWVFVLFFAVNLLTGQAKAHRYPYSGECKLERLTPNIYAALNLYYPSSKVGVNAVFMATDGSLIFIDAGMNMDSAEAIWSEATKLFPGKTSYYLILTHFHCDHVFGMNFFKNRGANVIGHNNIEPWLDQKKFIEILRKTTGRAMTFVDVISLENYSSSEEAKKILGDVRLSPPDFLIDGDYVLEVNDLRLNIFHVPGHSPDLIVVYESQTQTLVASDLIYCAGEPFLHDKTLQGYKEWENSLTRINDFPTKKTVPGHGPICDKTMIDKNIQSLRKQARNLKRMT
jgi:glyoxylase-like metal-dependent hydrolase (beta-lactamase superfamily II)